MWALKIELAWCRVEGMDAAPLQHRAWCCCQSRIWQQGKHCPSVLQGSSVLVLSPVPAELPWVPPAHPGLLLMLKPSAATGPGLPRLRELMDISHPAWDRLQAWRGGSFWCHSLSWGVCTQSLNAGHWGDPTDFGCPSRKQQVGAAPGLEVSQGHRVHFQLCHLWSL